MSNQEIEKAIAESAAELNKTPKQMYEMIEHFLDTTWETPDLFGRYRLKEQFLNGKPTVEEYVVKKIADVAAN